MKKLLFYLLMIIFGFESFSQCAQPTNLTIENYTTTIVDLSWTPGDSTQYYWEIQVSANDSTFLNSNSYWSTTPYYTLVGITQGIMYYIRVRAICGNDFSTFSPYVATPYEACVSPYNVTVTNITTTSAELNFSHNNTYFSSWELSYKINDINTPFTIVDIDTNYYKFENLQPNTRYIYYVRTKCGDMLSDIYMNYSFTTAPLNVNALNNNKTFYTCGEYVFDDGGEIGDHGNNYSYSLKLCPTDNTNYTKRMSLRFDEFSLGSGDEMTLRSNNNYIVDNGTSVFTNTYLSGKTIYSNINDTTGCITISVNTNPTASSSGFKIYASCVDRCQIPLADLDTFYAKIDKNTYYNTYSYKYITDSSQSIPTQYRVIDFCEGDKVILHAKPQFPENGNSYNQNSSNCIYYWSFGDGSGDTTYYQNNQVTYQWNDVGIYKVDLIVKDTTLRNLFPKGCPSINPINTIVRVSKNPIKSVEYLPNICSGQPFNLSAGYDDNNILVLDTIGIKFSPVFRDEQLLPIPDGPLANNSNLELPLNISGYSSGELITSSDDVVSCCVKMEHSFIGDLIMTLQCPNGQQALLKSKNGGGKYLGIPAGGDAHSQYDYSNSINPGTPGEGWNYCFSDKYTASNTTYNLLNNCNQVNGISMTNYSWNCYTCDSTHKFDTSNYFTPESSFTNLIGCPKNGEWKIIIMDDWAIDNGFVFSWDIEFSPDGSELYSYQVIVDTIIWDSPFISLQNSFSTIINPPFDSIGIYNTSISVIDEYGCVYDTNTSLNVIQSPTAPTNLNLSFEGNNIELTWDGTAISYQIFRDDVFIAQVNQPIFIDPNLDITTNYCYKVLALGEECNSDFSNVKCSLIGLDEEISNDMTANLYPNPTNDKTILEIKGLNNNSDVLVYDLQGRILKTYKFNLGQDKLEIDASNLTKGIYYIKVKNSEKSLTKKLIVN